MSDSANFFEQSTPLPALNAPAPAGKRAFYYDGTFFEDPGSEYSVQEILGFLSQTYPELEGGTWHSRQLPDGTEEITFVKVTGEKGLSDFTPHQLLVGLQTLPACQPAAIPLTRHLVNQQQRVDLTTDQLLARLPEIEVALTELNRLADDSQKVVARCLTLPPTPLSRIPTGF